MLFRLFAISALFVVLAQHQAYAGDPSIRRPKAAEAVDHLSRGNKLYNVRSFEDAAVEYKAGALIEPAPIFDYNLGQCYRQLKKYPDAIWHYERFAKASPETPEHVATVEKFIAEMKAELGSKAASEPPTEPVAPPTTAAPTPAISAPVVTARTPIPSRGDPWYADGFGWGLTGVGLASATVGAVLLINARSLNDDANHAASQQDANALHDKADTRQLLGAVIGIGGVGLLVTGVIKLAVHSDDNTSTGVNVGLLPHGVTVFGRF